MLLSIGVALVAFLCLAVLAGGRAISPAQVVTELLRGPTGESMGPNAVVWRFRVPVALACLFVGGTLGIVGSAFQALFRNPLADPFIVGVASGAAVGGVAALVSGVMILGMLTLPVAGFVSGLAALTLVLFLSRRRGLVDVSSLLLAGAVTGSLLAAVQSLLLLSTGHDSNQVLQWLLGNMQQSSPEQVWLMAITLLVGSMLMVRQGRRLNALAIGEDTAQRLGIDVKRLRSEILITGTAMVAVCVGAVGVIGFIGLAAPHIARRLVGVDWRWSLIGSLLTGSCLLLLANVIAIQISPTGELPVGIVTALLGAPFLLVLLRRD